MNETNDITIFVVNIMTRNTLEIITFLPRIGERVILTNGTVEYLVKDILHYIDYKSIVVFVEEISKDNSYFFNERK